MTKYNPNRSVYGLDVEILAAEVEDLKEADLKDVKKKIKRVFLTASPMVISSLLSIATGQILIAGIGTVLTGSIGVFEKIYHDESLKKLTIDDLNDMRVHANEEDIYTPEDDEEENELYRVSDDLYREDFLRWLNYHNSSYTAESTDLRKYNEALKKQQGFREPDIKPIRIVDKSLLIKEEAIKQVEDEVRILSLVYKCPPITITSEQWDIVCDEIYKLLLLNNKENYYFSYLLGYTRFIIAKAVYHRDEKISVKDFVDNLYFIETGMLENANFEEFMSNLNKMLQGTNITRIDGFPIERARKKRKFRNVYDNLQ